MKSKIQNAFNYVVSWIKFAEEKIGRKALISIVAGVVFLVIGLIILSRPNYIYQEGGNKEVPKLSTEEAKSIVDSTLENIFKIYEEPKEIFEVEAIKAKPKEVEEDDDEIIDDYTAEKKEAEKERLANIIEKYEIKDYDKKIGEYFTSAGKKEFEAMTFKGEKFFEKDQDSNKIYFNTSIVTSENKFSDDTYTISNIVIDNGEITCSVHFSRLSINENDEVSYAVYSKNITLVKSINNWLVASFKYSIEK